MCGCLSHAPNREPGLQLRHVPLTRNQTSDTLVQLALARPREKKGKESWLGLLYGCPNNNNHNDDLKTFEPWLVWLSGLSAGLRTKVSLV